MARIVKVEEREAKRNQILDLTLNLVYTKGYELMSIQDILDALHISKGAFYHYFDSKQALIEALVERMGKEVEQTLLLLFGEPELSAPEKIHRYLESAVRINEKQKSMVASSLRMWYADENTVIRQKAAAESIKQTARLLEPIIRQGLAEQVFLLRFPEQIAVIVAGITLNLTDTMMGLLLAPHRDQAIFLKWEVILAAHSDAIERLLGAPAGSLKVTEQGAFKEWLSALAHE